MKKLIEYLDLSAMDRKSYLSSCLHYIKFSNLEECIEMFGNVEVGEIEDDQLLDAVRLATGIEYALGVRFGFAPKWLNDERLRLTEPNEPQEPEILFFCPQAMLNHNYFCDLGNFQVI
jgi:hypothetical protein